MSNLILVSGVPGVSVTIGSQAYTDRQTALDDARMVRAVTDQFGQGSAVDALRAVKTLIAETEKARKAVKAPVLDLGKRIDTLAAEFTGELEREAARLSGLLTGYELEQRRIAAEEQRKRDEAEHKAREESARIERERQEAEARARREAEEAERKAREAGDAEARKAAAEARAKADAEAARVAAERAKAEADARIAAALAAQNAPVVERAQGQVVSDRWTFDVVDVRALAAACPDLVTITPKRADILALIRSGTREIAGLTIRKETSVSVR